ncbi:hypothetical protein B0H14DRAFT_2942653 [Mycena olivaceomarginata]|nr:hypothetical protein B0H14DRAFT_2942653 [Mycena olivaceomarginata]
MFVLFTCSCLLVSRKKCMLFPYRPSSVRFFPHHPCFSCLLFFALLPLASACFALPLYSQSHSFPLPPPVPIQIVRPFIPFLTTHITFSACSSTNRFGIRAFFKHGTAVNHSLF